MAKLEESDPLLKHLDGASQEAASLPLPPVEAQRAPPSAAPQVTAPSVPTKGHAQWAAEALPVLHGSVIGEPVPRDQWSSGLFDCLGRNDEFCSSDLEVCMFQDLFPLLIVAFNCGFSVPVLIDYCRYVTNMITLRAPPLALMVGPSQRRVINHKGFYPGALVLLHGEVKNLTRHFISVKN